MANSTTRDVLGTNVNFRPVWDGDDGQELGSFIGRQIGPMMVESNNTVVLENVRGDEVVIGANTDDWSAFIDTYLKAPGGSGISDAAFMAEHPRGIVGELGMSYSNLCRLLDDMGSEVKTAAKPDGISGEKFVVKRDGQWAQVGRVYEAGDTYGFGQEKLANVPIAPGSGFTIELVPQPTIGAEILTADARMDRDRVETEKHIEVKVTNGQSDNLFRDASTNEHYQAMDVLKLGPYQERAGFAHVWQDDRAVDLFERFPYPMVLERNRDDDTGYQGNRSAFIEGLLDTPDFMLRKAGLMLRFRWRPEQDGRTNIQGKSDMGDNPDTGLAEQQKFEHRNPRGSSVVSDDGIAMHLDEMQIMAESGMMGADGSIKSSVHKRIYELLIEKGVIRRGDKLELGTKVVDYQDRRRTHLIFYSQRQMETLRDTLKADLDNFDDRTQGADPQQKQIWKDNLEQMTNRCEAVITKLESSNTMLQKYNERLNTSSDGLIISRDEKVGFEGAAFGNGTGIWPGDRRGRPAHWVSDGDGNFEPRFIDGADRVDQLGDSILRAESELDAAVSSPIDRAIERAEAVIAGTGTVRNVDVDQAKADLAELTTIRNELSLCTDSAMEVQAEAFEAVGLEVDRDPKGGSTWQQFADELMEQGPRSWVTVRFNAALPPRPAPLPEVAIDEDVRLFAGREHAFEPVQIDQATTMNFNMTPLGRGQTNDMDLYVRIGEAPEINDDGTGAYDFRLFDTTSRESGKLEIPANAEVHIVARSKGRVSNANVNVTY